MIQNKCRNGCTAENEQQAHRFAWGGGHKPCQLRIAGKRQQRLEHVATPFCKAQDARTWCKCTVCCHVHTHAVGARHHQRRHHHRCNDVELRKRDALGVKQRKHQEIEDGVLQQLGHLLTWPSCEACEQEGSLCQHRVDVEDCSEPVAGLGGRIKEDEVEARIHLHGDECKRQTYTRVGVGERGVWVGYSCCLPHAHLLRAASRRPFLPMVYPESVVFFPTGHHRLLKTSRDAWRHPHGPTMSVLQGNIAGILGLRKGMCDHGLQNCWRHSDYGPATYVPRSRSGLCRITNVIGCR